MKRFSDIASFDQVVIRGNANIEILDVQIDSRKCLNQSVYAALNGTQSDGHEFIVAAIENGATVIIHQQDLNSFNPDICYVQTQDVPKYLGSLLYEFYEKCLDELVIIGTTGTNGKTTVSTLLYELFMRMGYSCGLISTVTYKINQREIQSTHTTPDIISLHRLLRNMYEEGCTHIFMEVSSHAIHQKRIAGIPFYGGIFTNITHDHLDYHGTFDQYIKAKKAFFDELPAHAFSLTNKDDKNGIVMLQNSKSSRFTYGLNGTADFNAKIWESDFTGMHIRLGNKDIWTPLVGKFNVYNLLAVYAAASIITEGKEEEIEIEMSALGRVKGRFETLNGPAARTVIIDYAHTPDALKNVISTIKEIQNDPSQLIVVVGCGGNRDKEKRAPMGAIASELGSRCLFTSDNPRFEDPQVIIDEMMQGVSPANLRKVLKISDRKEAIRTAIALSFPGDVILIAGKGHENYQESNGTKHEFNDHLEAQLALKDIR
jgi:UDP-N-acetylmuramoyl-L-alanyl-D-glutamate--2,6-diaminopimelate ligase